MFDDSPQATTDPNLTGSIRNIDDALKDLQTEATRILDPLKEIPNQLNKITIERFDI